MNAARQLPPLKGFVKMKFPFPTHRVSPFTEIHIVDRERPPEGMCSYFGMKIADRQQELSNP
jgi:hypothetical protein